MWWPGRDGMWTTAGGRSLECVDMHEFETRARELVQDGTLGYDQKLRKLAAFGDDVAYELIARAI